MQQPCYHSMTSQANAWSYCMGSVVSISFSIYLNSSYFVLRMWSFHLNAWLSFPPCSSSSSNHFLLLPEMEKKLLTFLTTVKLSLGFMQLGFLMKLTHLSPVQNWFIISRSKVFIHEGWCEAILIKIFDN